MKKTSLVIILTLTLPLNLLAFSDLDSSHEYYDSVTYIHEAGIVQGYEDGSFKPDKTINRAEMLKIIVEAFYPDFSKETARNECFPDVDSEDWYESYVCYAKEQGIVRGYDDGTFRAKDNINFVEAMKIAMIGNGYEYITSDPWYKALVKDASESNYIPLSITSFSQEITRGEMSDIIARILNDKADTLTVFLGDDASYRVTYEALNGDTPEAGPEEIDINNPPQSGNCDSGDYAPDLLCLINKHRDANGLKPFVMDENLMAVAIAHSKWMDENDELTHIADGKDPFDRCQDLGVDCDAENIAMSSRISAQTFFDLWEESPTHNANMLGEYTTIGIGLSGVYSTTVMAY